MKEATVHVESAIIAHDQAAEVPQPRERAFDFPPLAIPAHHSPIVHGRSPTLASVRAEQEHATLEQPPAQRVAVVAPVGNDPQGTRTRTPRTSAGNRDGPEGSLGQLYFRRRGAGQLASQRNTLAVDHHHPLRPLAPLGLPDGEAPFLAGAKLPSRKLSLQSRRPR